MTLKLRAWDKTKKIMCDVQAINFGLRTVYLINRTGIGGQWSAPFDDVVLMQSTGLIDKNGQEIFEGDVVKFGAEGLYIVEWSKKEAAYRLISVDKRWSDCYFSNYENITKIIEVVGNIWENPELTEETHSAAGNR